MFHRAGFDDDDITYVVGHDDVRATRRPRMPLWREKLFVVLYRNATNVTERFNLPPDRVIEIRTPVEL